MTNLFGDIHIDSKLSSIKKFYFLEYFYIFLKSVSKTSLEQEVFTEFKVSKDEYKLGESRFKKLGVNTEEKKLNRYKYTFKEVLEELESYKLVKRENGQLILTARGLELLNKYDSKRPEIFYSAIFNLMEDELNGFYQLVNLCYQVNKNGLLIFPIYSPLKLGIQKESILVSGDIMMYLDFHASRLEKDILVFLKEERSLVDPLNTIKSKLIESNLMSSNDSELINPDNYYIILKRIRDFWLNYFLREIYGISLSLSYFDIWCYRGKQIGVMNITEFYPGFDGRIVYPVSIISKSISSGDFRKIYTYKTNESLFLHEPHWQTIQDDFVKVLYESYIDLRHSSKSYFVNIADLRDIVCFRLKISYNIFQDFLAKLYILNLNNETTIKISLEADKLPDETKLVYQKRDPIEIDGLVRNIIAIELKK